jgi:hypothetical protein
MVPVNPACQLSIGDGFPALGALDEVWQYQHGVPLALHIDLTLLAFLLRMPRTKARVLTSRSWRQYQYM